MDKIENSELEREIARLYESGAKKRKISRLLKVSTTYVDRVVLEKGKPKRVLLPEPGFLIVAKCRKTGKIFEDFENKSGIITRHVIEQYPELTIPTAFKRRKYFKENNRFWYENFLDIIQTTISETETKKCKYCNWNTFDLENKSGWYTKHLLDVHKKSVDEYLLDFPEEKTLFKTFVSKYEQKSKMLSSGKNHIECGICGEKMSKVTNTHLKSKHGISLVDYRILYRSTLSESSLDKFKKNYEENLKELPGRFVSGPQAEISAFISDLGFSVEINNKSLLSGIEMDIFVKEAKFAIEFDGLYFHSENSGNKDRLYHKKKTELANSKGIRLVHIFEDEWQNRKNIVKSKIRHILGVGNCTRLHARKMDLREITRQEKDVFLESCHIQGCDESDISVGAFSGDLLCAVMTFDNRRLLNREKVHSADTYELKRFATAIGHAVPGIASRLLKYFVREFSPKRIISFADLRWSSQESNLYEKLGFRLDKVIPPDYSYTFYRSGVAYRFHKFGFGKKSISKKFPEVFDPNATEWEMMQKKGFDRIWDCGKLRYLLEL